MTPTTSKQQAGPNLEILKVKMTDLVPHEGILDWHLKETVEWIARDSFQLRPIAISRLDALGRKWEGRFLIHDGHHRTAALKKLDCSYIMGSVFDFTDPRIKVFDYNDMSLPVTKQEVIRRATSGMEVTPRYDKHFIEVDGKLEPFHDNDLLEPKMPTPLSKLK
ncbi:MAG: hypothetical protein ACREBS_03305 [Nitrososphaerales archaeon]